MRALLTACFSALLLVLPATGAGAATWAAGGFTFSDELGGFRLISVSGTGSANDPLVIVEEIGEVLPVTLVIRKDRTGPQKDSAIPGQAFVNLAVIKVVINTSKRVWGAFDLELQEVLKEPSPYGDGLSFDQMRGFDEVVSSDSFASSRQVYEPYDRVRFQDGSVGPRCHGALQLSHHRSDSGGRILSAPATALADGQPLASGPLFGPPPPARQIGKRKGPGRKPRPRRICPGHLERDRRPGAPLLIVPPAAGRVFPDFGG